MAETTTLPGSMSDIPLIAHIVHRFDYGGMENGLVNIINTMDQAAYRHAVIALTEASEFADRIHNPSATVYSLHKKSGKDPRSYVRLWSLLRRLRPAILHSRNIGTMDCVVVGRLAGISVCVHGEHGWDTHDPDGRVAKYRRIRQVLNPLVSAFIAVSRDLANWLTEIVRIPPAKITAICNGVDTELFAPGKEFDRALLPQSFQSTDSIIVGSALRFQPIKDPLNLVRAFVTAHATAASNGIDLRLVMIGDGSLKSEAEQILARAGLSDSAWLPGMRDDVAKIMRTFDMFVLPSLREGISNTILEALASGLPVVATRTGGNPELVDDGHCGALVATESSAELAAAICRYASDNALRHQHSAAARQRAIDNYSLQSMADSYQAVYDAALTKAER